MTAWRTPQEFAAADLALAKECRDLATRVRFAATGNHDRLVHECLLLAEALEQRVREMTK